MDTEEQHGFLAFFCKVFGDWFQLLPPDKIIVCIGCQYM